MLSLLRENNNNNSYSLNSITNKPKSFEEYLLELNDCIHEAYIEDYIDGLKSNMVNRVIYRSILEDTGASEGTTNAKKKENIFKRIYNAIKKWITNIINYFKNLFGMFKQLDEYMEQIEEEIARQYGVDLNNYTVMDTTDSDGISNTFKQAVIDQDYSTVRRKLREMLGEDDDVLDGYRILNKYVDYAIASMHDSLWENHDNTINPIILDADKWNLEYLSGQLRQLLNNFSKERFDHIKKVEKYMRKKTSSTYKNLDNLGNVYESAVENNTKKSSIKTFFSDTREFTLFYFPSVKDITPSIYDFLTQSIDKIILPKIRNNSESKNRNELVAEIENDILAGLYSHLPKNDKVTKFASTEDYKSYISEVCYRKTVKCTGMEYMKNHNANKENPIALNNTEYIKKLNDLNRALDKMLSSFANSTDKDKDTMIIILTFLSDVTKLTSQLINNSIKSYSDMGKYFIRLFSPYTKSSKNESGFIHGEPFDGDTLFANGDYRDFNPTEWMNLELTTEMYEIKYAIGEFKKNVAIKEANILLNDHDPKQTMNELISMCEAEEKKFNLNIDTIIYRISEMINKFLGLVKDKFSQDSILLKKNAEKMKEPFKFENVSSKGNIIAGIDRVQIHFDIRYDEATMKDDTKKDIFEKQVLTKLDESIGTNNKRKFSWEPDKMEISEYCKIYFGGPMSDSAEGFTLCEYTGDELNSLKDKITNFINNFNRITASVNNDLNSLKVESKKLGVKTVNTTPTAGSTTNTTQTTAQQTNTAQNVTPQNNSATYYSILYDRYLNEADIVKVETSEKNDTNTSNNTTNNNAADGDKKTVNGASEYFNCYKDVIAAKLTAIEFIHSELMQIIRNHLGIKTTPDNNKDANKK